MKEALGILAGLVWGGVWGVVNVLILKKSIRKNDNNAIMAANMGRMGIDLLALLAVFLLRKVLPVPYEFVLIGTAVALSAVTLIFAFRYGKKK